MLIRPFFKFLSHAFLLYLWWEVGCASFPFSLFPCADAKCLLLPLSPSLRCSQGSPPHVLTPSAHSTASESPCVPPARPGCPSCGQGSGPPCCPVASHSGTLSSDGGSGRCSFPYCLPQTSLELTFLSTEAHGLWSEPGSQGVWIQSLVFYLFVNLLSYGLCEVGT